MEVQPPKFRAGRDTSPNVGTIHHRTKGTHVDGQGSTKNAATPTRPLAGKTIVMSGGSRGIGQAIALRAAADGANIVLIAKTTDPHPGLTGTIHTAAAAIEDAGGRALAFAGDIRSDAIITAAVRAAIETFGGIDICVNNASVLNLASTLELDPKQYDLMQDVNVRGTFQLSRACMPHLLKAKNPHVLSLSPPLNLTPRWLGAHPAYTLAKYGMTIATLGGGSRVRSPRRGRELPVAPNANRHRRNSEPDGWCRSGVACPQPEDHGGRGPRHIHLRLTDTHRCNVNRRRGPAWRRNQRFLCLR